MYIYPYLSIDRSVYLSIYPYLIIHKSPGYSSVATLVRGGRFSSWWREEHTLLPPIGCGQDRVNPNTLQVTRPPHRGGC